MRFFCNHGAGRLLRACDHYERGSGLMDVIEAEDMGMPGEIPEMSGTQQLEQVQPWWLIPMGKPWENGGLIIYNHNYRTISITIPSGKHTKSY